MSAGGASAATTGSAIDNAIVIDLDDDEVGAFVKKLDDSALKEAAYAREPPAALAEAGKRIKEAVENAKNFERGMTHQDDEDPVQLEALLELVRQRIEEATHVWADTLAGDECVWYPHPINARDHGRVTPAHTCAGSAVPLTLQVLLDTHIVDLNQRNQFGETPLTRLLSYGRLRPGAVQCANQFIDYMARAGSDDKDETMAASLLEMAQLRHVGVDVLEPLVEAWRASRGAALEPPPSALPAATTGKRPAEPEPEPDPPRFLGLPPDETVEPALGSTNPYAAPMSAKARGKRPM